MLRIGSLPMKPHLKFTPSPKLSLTEYVAFFVTFLFLLPTGLKSLYFTPIGEILLTNEK